MIREKKHNFIGLAIAILIIAPIIVWVVPFIVQGILYDDANVWVLKTPKNVYILYTIGCVLLLFASIFSYLYYHKKVLFMSLGIVLALGIMAFASMSYVLVGEEGVAWRTSGLSQEKKYGWQDVEKVYLTIDNEEDQDYFEFHFKDGETTSIKRPASVEDFNSNLLQLKKIYGFPYTRKDL
ncbi:hypothetical protein FIU87_10495 [Bacillus sp. THAF10]|uniref:hypothetical protein n=1 Tax=Bacillus sp. THAF10 TaxID=2587848 RepID=UPI001267F7AF|nr:hypothetical protein [Bacillus sp. THAF10]QFT89075.1 hypothetical protein FIU87_10495 [Bacillus sp. THAF10]